jgi:molybdate transport system substrate-binding protein
MTARLLVWALIAMLAPSPAAASASERGHVPVIAAASDLRFAMEEIAALFQLRTGRTVRVSYGSSGNYFRQIQQGAPFELFMSADESFVVRLYESGRTEDAGVLYAVGRIVLFASTKAGWSPDAAFQGLRLALDAGRIRRFAIANPEHAPYGRAAEQALRHVGLWKALGPRVVYGENVSQAAQFATSGSADGGIFAYSLAFSPGVVRQGRYVLVPEHLHEPLRQRMVLVRGAGATARALYDYLQQPAARAVFDRYGFVRPAGP